MAFPDKMLTRFLNISQEFDLEFMYSPMQQREIKERLYFDLFKDDIKDYQICEKVVVFPKGTLERPPGDPHWGIPTKRLRYDSDVKIFYSSAALSTRKSVRFKVKSEWEQLQLYVLKHYYPSWSEEFVTKYTLCQCNESLHLGLDIYSTHCWGSTSTIDYVLDMVKDELVRKRVLDFQNKVISTMISNQLRTIFELHISDIRFPTLSIRQWLMSPTNDCTYGEVIAGLLSTHVPKHHEKLECQIQKFENKCAIKIVFHEKCYRHYLP